MASYSQVLLRCEQFRQAGLLKQFRDVLGDWMMELPRFVTFYSALLALEKHLELALSVVVEDSYGSAASPGF